MRQKQKRQIAPRLASGDPRAIDSGRLPDDIKEAIRTIAKMENRSMSWVKERALISFFGFKDPVYVGEDKTRKVRKDGKNKRRGAR